MLVGAFLHARPAAVLHANQPALLHANQPARCAVSSMLLLEYGLDEMTLKRQYKSMARKLHPDCNPHSSTELFAELTNEYNERLETEKKNVADMQSTHSQLKSFDEVSVRSEDPEEADELTFALVDFLKTPANWCASSEDLLGGAA